MDRLFFFVSHSPSRQNQLEELLDNFCRENSMFSPAYELKKIMQTESGEIFEVKISFSFSTVPAPEKIGDYANNLYRRLVALALTNRFRPLDKDGHEIFLTPPYGFDIIFYHTQINKAQDLENIVISLGQEMPGHDGQFNLQTHKAEDEPGEYYFLQIRIQDYWTPEARNRLMLAYYFRLLLLARRVGFEPVATG